MVFRHPHYPALDVAFFHHPCYADKKARKMTDESKKQLAESKIAIAQRVEELDKKYEESVEEKDKKKKGKKKSKVKKSKVR